MMGERKIEDTPLPALFEQSQHIHSMAQDSTVDQVLCYLGELTEKPAHTDRIKAHKVIQERLEGFISSCETLELVPAEQIEAPIQRGLDPAARRARKIARLKRQKAAESKLQEIKERKERRGRSSKAAALTTPVEFGEDDEPDDDGEEEREAWLPTISLATCKALGLLERLKEEEEMLSAVKEKQSQVPCYLGELTEKPAHTDWIQALKVIQERLKEFNSSCETPELVPAEEIEAPIQRGLDPAARRARKIAHFKRQKAAESKLQEIKERKERRGRSSKAAALTTPVAFGEDDEPDDDGEEEQEALLTTISSDIGKALGLLEMLKKEEEMRSAVKEKQSQGGDMEAILDERTKKAETWLQKAAKQAQFSKPAQSITCAASAQDVLEGRAKATIKKKKGRAKASQVHEHKHQPMISGPASVVERNLTTEGVSMTALFETQLRMPTIPIRQFGIRWEAMVTEALNSLPRFQQPKSSHLLDKQES